LRSFGRIWSLSRSLRYSLNRSRKVRSVFPIYIKYARSRLASLGRIKNAYTPRVSGSDAAEASAKGTICHWRLQVSCRPDHRSGQSTHRWPYLAIASNAIRSLCCDKWRDLRHRNNSSATENIACDKGTKGRRSSLRPRPGVLIETICQGQRKNNRHCARKSATLRGRTDVVLNLENLHLKSTPPRATGASTSTSETTFIRVLSKGLQPIWLVLEQECVTVDHEAFGVEL
jgi:hypothetical protein